MAAPGTPPTGGYPPGAPVGPPGAPPGYYPPPPYGPPPYLMYPPPPGGFRPQRSFARIIFTTLAGLIFSASIMLNLYLLVAGGLGGGLGLSTAGITQTVVVEGDARQKIAVVPVTGVIMDPTAERFGTMMGLVEKDPHVKGLIIEVDTPGGAVTASDEIYARIQRFKQTKKIPVVVSMGSLATSGGYYVSCAGDYVFAQRTTITGNIGVISPRMNLAKLASAYGVEEVTITSPPQGFKNAGSSFHPMTSEERQYLQGLADDALKSFKNAITTGRPQLASSIHQIADGKALTATEAKNLGLVDAIGYPEDAYDFVAKKAGLTNKHVIRYNKPTTLLDLLSGGGAEGSFSGVGGGRELSVPAGAGVNVKIDAALLDELNRPRLMYLWRGQ